MMNYIEIKSEEPLLKDCFFAFSKNQVEEGLKKHDLTRDQVYSYNYGLIGTKQGVAELMEFYDKQRIKIKDNCDPQGVYNYEFSNHECGYIGDDEEAINMIIDYFGIDIARTIKRRYAYKKI